MFFSFQPNNTPDPKIYIWDIDTDTIHTFDFTTGQEVGGDMDDGTDIVGRAQQAADIAGRIPISQFWDATDPKLIVCETTSSSSALSHGKEKPAKKLFSITAKENKEKEQQVGQVKWEQEKRMGNMRTKNFTGYLKY